MINNNNEKKYPRDFILQVMSDYQQRIRSVKELSEYYEVPYNTVKYWAKKYNRLGIEAFYPRQKSNYITYSPNFKVRVVEYWLEHPEISTYEMAQQFHASRSAIRNWRIKYLEHGMDALFSETRGRKLMKYEKKHLTTSKNTMPEDVEDLKRRVYELEMENDYLKKLNALAREKERLQRKKKSK